MFGKDYTRPRLTNDAYMKFRVSQTLDLLSGRPGGPGGPSDVIWQPRSANDFQDEEYEPARVSDRKQMFEKRKGNSGKGMRPKFFDPTGKDSMVQQPYSTQYLSKSTASPSENQGVSYVSPSGSTWGKDGSFQRPPPANLKAQSKVLVQRANYDMPTPKPFARSYGGSRIAVHPVSLSDQFWDQHEQRFQELRGEQQQQKEAAPSHAKYDREESSDSSDMDEPEAPPAEEKPRYRTLLDHQIAILQNLGERPVSPPAPGLHRPSTYVQRRTSKTKSPQKERPTSTHGQPAEQTNYAPSNSMPVHAPPPHYHIRELELLVPKESIVEKYRRWLIETGKLKPTPTLVPATYPGPGEQYGTNDVTDDDYIGFIKHEIAREKARLEQEARRAEQEAIYKGCHQEVGFYDNQQYNLPMSQLSIGIPGGVSVYDTVSLPIRGDDDDDVTNTTLHNFSDF